MKVATPNGRFTENALICTSMSNFHQHRYVCRCSLPHVGEKLLNACPFLPPLP